MVRLWFFYIFFLVCTFTNGHFLAAQVSVEEIKLSSYDLRTETPQRAVISAIQASKNKAIIVMTRGAKQELIDRVKTELKVLIRNGYKRIVMVVAQPFEDDPDPLITIYANGHPFAMLKNAENNARTSVDLYRLVDEAYNTFVNVN